MVDDSFDGKNFLVAEDEVTMASIGGPLQEFSASLESHNFVLIRKASRFVDLVRHDL